MLWILTFHILLHCHSSGIWSSSHLVNLIPSITQNALDFDFSYSSGIWSSSQSNFQWFSTSVLCRHSPTDFKSVYKEWFVPPWPLGHFDRIRTDTPYIRNDSFPLNHLNILTPLDTPYIRNDSRSPLTTPLNHLDILTPLDTPYIRNDSHSPLTTPLNHLDILTPLDTPYIRNDSRSPITTWTY